MILEGYWSTCVCTRVFFCTHLCVTELAVNSMDCHIRIYDVEAQELEQTIDCGSLNSWKLSYHHEGKHLATGTHKGQIQIWDTETGQLGTTLDTHGSFTTTVAYVRVHEINVLIFPIRMK